MLIWSGWGIVVVVIGAIGMLVGVMAADTFNQTFGLAYGPSQSAGIELGGVLAASGIFFFSKWRESGEGRVFIDEATGQRIEVRPSAGSLFFIPSRYWTWIVLALSTLIAVTMWTSAGPGSVSY